MKYKPTNTATIEAWQWDGSDDVFKTLDNLINASLNSFGKAFGVRKADKSARLWVKKSNAWCDVEIGDYVVREPDGDGFYPCKKDIFEARYVPSDTDADTDWNAALRRAKLK